ncbi:Uncharacterized protein FKW44_025305 [Caligus rogercresseyi]|uniref:Uncharacterized protein n=1 Tax=Caligus rogercresseyi TaxID=217165 RepID=A0A7T8GLB5_CALRO|nr:Uncharacterized protein FKW44_025305 [Caligus rogercresseyi]
MSLELERRTAIIEIIDFFKFPKATVYSIAKSFKESEYIEEGFLTPEERLHVQFVQNWCLKISTSGQGVLAPSSPDVNPCDCYLWGVLERDTNKRAHNTVDSLKAAIIQAVPTCPGNRWLMPLGGSGTVGGCYCERRKLD